MKHPIVHAVTIFLIILLIFSVLGILYSGYKSGSDWGYLCAFGSLIMVAPAALYYNGVLNAAAGY
jgi:di/tricarboxylate transporter